MTKYVVLGALALVVFFIILLRPGRRTVTSELGDLCCRPPLSLEAQQLYARLQAALPSYRILSAVSLGAFVDCTAADKLVRQQRRELIRRFAVDFLICDRQLRPIAAIELEDVVLGNQDREGARRLLREASLPVLRWTTVGLPELEEIRDALAELESAASLEFEPALLGADARREPYL